MKIRTDFVTNSSSSSFCLFGICDFNIYDTIQNKIENEDNSTSVSEELEKIFNGLAILDTDNHCTYIGLHPDNCKDDQTMGEFKEETISFIQQKYLKYNLNPPAKNEFDWYTGEIYS